PPRSRDAMRPSGAYLFRPNEGVGNAGCPLHPQPRVRMVVGVCTRVFTASSPGSPDIPARNGLRLIPRSPRRSGFLASVAPKKLASQELDASVEASGPHDFAVRVSAVRYRHLDVHRIPLRVRDDREPPLMWNETAIICEVIWVGREQKYFCKRDWTD